MRSHYRACLGEEAAEELGRSLSLTSSDSDAILRCFSDPLLNGPDCFGYLKLLTRRQEDVGRNWVTDVLVANQPGKSVLRCQAQFKDVFLDSPLARSKCKLLTTYGEALSYVQDPDQIVCCISLPAKRLQLDLRRFLACGTAKIGYIANVTMRMVGVATPCGGSSSSSRTRV